MKGEKPSEESDERQQAVAQSEFAPAKVNLTLHLRGQRTDGYHLLDSLVVFPRIGDRLHAEPGTGVSLSLAGPFADGLSASEDNLVLRAAEAVKGLGQGAALMLEKNLPVASGIGGGSSDAAAALRLLSRLWGAEMPADRGLSLGADVPVCLGAPKAQRMQGIGEHLTPAPLMPNFWMVLVNPMVGVPTGAVFNAVPDKCPPETPEPPGKGLTRFEELADWLKTQRNDLQAAACAICPPISDVLAALQKAPVARMSGSGATCFAVVPGEMDALALSDWLRRERPEWWVAAAPV